MVLIGHWLVVERCPLFFLSLRSVFAPFAPSPQSQLSLSSVSGCNWYFFWLALYQNGGRHTLRRHRNKLQIPHVPHQLDLLLSFSFASNAASDWFSIVEIHTQLNFISYRGADSLEVACCALARSVSRSKPACFRFYRCRMSRSSNNAIQLSNISNGKLRSLPFLSCFFKFM